MISPLSVSCVYNIHRSVLEKRFHKSHAGLHSCWCNGLFIETTLSQCDKDIVPGNVTFCAYPCSDLANAQVEIAPMSTRFKNARKRQYQQRTSIVTTAAVFAISNRLSTIM